MSCATDISNLTPAELKQLVADAQAKIQEAEATKRANLRTEVTEYVKTSGYDIYELFGIQRKSTPAKVRATGGKSNLPAKYADPRNPGTTWVGRGKRPRWVTDYLTGGGQLSDLAIKAA